MKLLLIMIVKWFVIVPLFGLLLGVIFGTIASVTYCLVYGYNESAIYFFIIVSIIFFSLMAFFIGLPQFKNDYLYYKSLLGN
jgi:hypothetical protein